MSKIILAFALLFTMACNPSQSTSSKKGFLKLHHDKKAFGKSTGYFRIEIKTNSKIDGQIEFIAEVTALKNMGSVDYEWKLPDSLVPLDGPLKNQLDFIGKGSHQVSIQLRTQDLKDNDQIFFFVYQMKNGERHGASKSFVFSESPKVEASSQKQKFNKTPKYFE